MRASSILRTPGLKIRRHLVFEGQQNAARKRVAHRRLVSSWKGPDPNSNYSAHTNKGEHRRTFLDVVVNKTRSSNLSREHNIERSTQVSNSVALSTPFLPLRSSPHRGNQHHFFNLYSFEIHVIWTRKLISPSENNRSPARDFLRRRI